MIEQLSIYLIAMILGIMLFFSFVIAPVVFTTLDEDNARKFIRRIFPFYYNVNLAISFIVLLLFLLLSKFGNKYPDTTLKSNNISINILISELKTVIP